MTISSGLIFVMGVIVGFFAALLVFLTASSGTIKIDHSNPAKDVYRLELKDLEGLPKKKRVLLKVNPNADLSQR